QVVGVRMAQQDARDPPSARSDYSVEMRGIVRTGVDYSDPVRLLDQPGVGAVIGHRTGVGRNDAPDARTDLCSGAAQRFGFGQMLHLQTPVAAWIKVHGHSRMRDIRGEYSTGGITIAHISLCNINRLIYVTL